MEYINIISKEAITTPIILPFCIVGGLAIAGVLGTMFYCIKTGKYNIGYKGYAIFGIGGIVLMILTMLICSIFFRVPTGRYRYEATINKDKMTVSQYEEFVEEYNPIIENGVYYWED